MLTRSAVAFACCLALMCSNSAHGTTTLLTSEIGDAVDVFNPANLANPLETNFFGPAVSTPIDGLAVYSSYFVAGAPGGSGVPGTEVYLDFYYQGAILPSDSNWAIGASVQQVHFGFGTITGFGSTALSATSATGYESILFGGPHPLDLTFNLQFDVLVPGLELSSIAIRDEFPGFSLHDVLFLLHNTDPAHPPTNFGFSPILRMTITSVTTDTALIPEPSSFVLAAMGLIGLAPCRWRRKRS
jgi:hypothetical protein